VSVRNGCSEVGNCIEEGRPPTSADGLYVDHFRKMYRGDACDAVASTSARLVTAPPLAGEDPCHVCIVGGSNHCSPGPGINCDGRVVTGVLLDSWIGNDRGNAPDADGQTAPAFCACDAYDKTDARGRGLLECKKSPADCVIADQNAFPVAGVPRNPAVHHGWRSMTQRGFNGNYPIAQSIDTRHREPAASNPNLPYTSAFVWDFTAERALYGDPNAAALAGILWTAVRTFRPADSVETRLSDLSNGYVGTIAQGMNRRNQVRFAPGLAGVTLDWLPIGPLDVPGLAREPAWLALPVLDGTATPITQTLRGVELSTHLFSQSGWCVVRGTTSGSDRGGTWHDERPGHPRPLWKCRAGP
jgi:hypothetical protein